MKKVLVITLTFLYLFSGVGFGTVEHYCQSYQNLVSACANHCCSDEVMDKEPLAHQIPAKPHADPCCDAQESILPTKDDNREFADNCCELQPDYNQLDSSTLPQNIEVSKIAKSIAELCYQYPQQTRNFDKCDLNIFTDPSIHTNLPLLI